jgi:hypothetical protein
MIIEPIDKARLYRWAYALAVVTVFYNLLEGSVSVFFGVEDGTVSLLGFGIDSFVEVISRVWIWHMVKRIRANGGEGIDTFERQALRVTGSAFYLLTFREGREAFEKSRQETLACCCGNCGVRVSASRDRPIG